MKSRIIAIAMALACMVTLVLVPGAEDRAEAATTRLAGADRYATSVAVSQALTYPTGGVVYLASGDGFADALAAAPVAAAQQGRLLLSTSDQIPASVIQEIRRLAPREIVIVGGTGSLSAGVANQAASLAPTVTRIAGSDRVETSMLLLDRLRSIRPTATVWVVDAGNFPDALAAGATAARFGQGLVLSWGADATFRAMVQQRDAIFGRVYVAGGSDAVSTATRSFLMQVVGGDVPRYAGENRYETAIAINRAFAPRGGSATMIMANGEGFADGLVASVLAANRGAPLYLTTASCAPSGGISDEFRRLRVTTTIVIGGTDSVSQNAVDRNLCPGERQAMYDEMVRQVNALRASLGLRPLTWDIRLQQLAQGWSEQQRTMSISHNPTFSQSIFAMGYYRSGENVAWRTMSDPTHPMELWIASPGHYANLTNPNFTHIGVGAAQDANGQWYWTQNFGGR